MEVKLGPDHPNTLLSMRDVAASLVQLDRGAEAVPLIDDCVRRAAGRVVHPELIPGAMGLRLEHFEKAKSAADCRATAEMWEKLGRTDTESLYTAARMRAVAAAVTRAADPSGEAARRADADRAMCWLRRAVAAGYANAPRVAKDADLDALRDRPDFKVLLADLEAGKKRDKK
jgi:hypothetical protein